MNWRLVEFLYLLFIWDHILVQPSHQDPAATNQHVSKEFDWLISDRGPFHHSRSYLSFVERHRQGFTTRYKIYRYVRFLWLGWVFRWWELCQFPWAPGWESIGDALLSLFHLEMLLWFPMALSCQCELLRRLGWSALIMRWRHCSVTAMCKAQSEMKRNWGGGCSSFVVTDSSQAGSQAAFSNQWSSGQPKPLYQTHTCELPIASGSREDVTTHVSVTVLTLLCRSLGCVLPTTDLWGFISMCKLDLPPELWSWFKKLQGIKKILQRIGRIWILFCLLGF